MGGEGNCCVCNGGARLEKQRGDGRYRYLDETAFRIHEGKCTVPDFQVSVFQEEMGEAGFLHWIERLDVGHAVYSEVANAIFMDSLTAGRTTAK